jgi:hypothetical protein
MILTFFIFFVSGSFLAVIVFWLAPHSLRRHSGDIRISSDNCLCEEADVENPCRKV